MDHVDQAKELAERFASPANRNVATRLFEAAIATASGAGSQLDLKIAAAALAEMGDAFDMFAAHRQTDKVTIFGSARTTRDDPLYDQAKRVAATLADRGWMVITGAGPGIMEAGMEGAGRDRSIGVSIRLPFETGANSVIAGDNKYVTMKYFFTRKLMLIKESKGFVCLPGGFGTLDETFELLTLIQTGKGLPVPVVLLDTPGDPYWETVDGFVRNHLVERGLVDASDTGLYLVTDDCQRAADEITDFYRNFDSIRYVGDTLVMRIRQQPTDQHIAALNERFHALCRGGAPIRRIEPYDIERREADRLELHRLAIPFGHHGYGELRSLIDTVNGFVSR